MKNILWMLIFFPLLMGTPVAGASLDEVAALVPTGLGVSETTVYRVRTTVNNETDANGYLEYWALPTGKVAIIGYRDSAAVSCRLYQEGIPHHSGLISSLSLLLLGGNRFFGLINTLVWQDTGCFLVETTTAGIPCYQVTVPGSANHRRVITIAQETGVPLAIHYYRGDTCYYLLAVESVANAGSPPKALVELLARSEQ